jgi:hypothetical protein
MAKLHPQLEAASIIKSSDGGIEKQGEHDDEDDIFGLLLAV